MTDPIPFPTAGGSYRWDGQALVQDDDARPEPPIETPPPPDGDDTLNPDPGAPGIHPDPGPPQLNPDPGASAPRRKK